MQSLTEPSSIYITVTFAPSEPEQQMRLFKEHFDLRDILKIVKRPNTRALALKLMQHKSTPPPTRGWFGLGKARPTWDPLAVEFFLAVRDELIGKPMTIIWGSSLFSVAEEGR